MWLLYYKAAKFSSHFIFLLMLSRMRNKEDIRSSCRAGRPWFFLISSLSPQILVNHCSFAFRLEFNRLLVLFLNKTFISWGRSAMSIKISSRIACSIARCSSLCKHVLSWWNSLLRWSCVWNRTNYACQIIWLFQHLPGVLLPIIFKCLSWDALHCLSEIPK